MSTCCFQQTLASLPNSARSILDQSAISRDPIDGLNVLSERSLVNSLYGVSLGSSVYERIPSFPDTDAYASTKGRTSVTSAAETSMMTHEVGWRLEPLYANLVNSIERIVDQLAELVETQISAKGRYDALVITGKLPMANETVCVPGVPDAYRKFKPRDWYGKEVDITRKRMDLCQAEKLAFTAAVTRVAMQVVQESNSQSTAGDFPEDISGQRLQQLTRSRLGLVELHRRLERDDAHLHKFSQRLARDLFHQFKFHAEIGDYPAGRDPPEWLTELREDASGLPAEERWRWSGKV
jgi:hypothetical protein